MDKLPRGIVASCVTPLMTEDEVAFDLIPDHIDWLIEEGVAGISPLGSSGEFVLFDTEVRKRIVEAVIEANHGRKPLVVGTHHYSTRRTLELCRHAERVGASALLVVPPYYMIPTIGQIMDHYRAIAEAVSIPVVLYHNASNTHIDLRTEHLVRLFEEGAIGGVKMSNPEAYRIYELLQATQDRLRVYVGIDTAAFEGLCYGAHGWISGVPSMVPRAARRLYEAIAVHKNLDHARDEWKRLVPLVRMEFGGYDRGDEPHWFSVMKAALNLIGPRVNDPALPVQPLAPEDRRDLIRILKDLGYEMKG